MENKCNCCVNRCICDDKTKELSKYYFCNESKLKEIHCWRYNELGSCLKCRDNNFMLWFYCSGFDKDDEKFLKVLQSL